MQQQLASQHQCHPLSHCKPPRQQPRAYVYPLCTNNSSRFLVTCKHGSSSTQQHHWRLHATKDTDGQAAASATSSAASGAANNVASSESSTPGHLAAPDKPSNMTSGGTLLAAAVCMAVVILVIAKTSGFDLNKSVKVMAGWGAVLTTCCTLPAGSDACDG